MGFVVSLNLHRRHLNESQRAMVAAKIANLEHGQRADRSIELSPVTQPDAAALLNVSVPSLKRAAKVQEEAAPEVVEAVEKGTVAVSAAVLLTELPEEQQKGFKECGAALAEIRDRRLYRECYKTFEAYALAEHGIRRTRAFQLVEAAGVARNLFTIVNIPQPQNEAQVRPLTILPTPEAQVKAWKAAVEQAGGKTPTAAIVKRAVDATRSARGGLRSRGGDMRASSPSFTAISERAPSPTPNRVAICVVMIASGPYPLREPACDNRVWTTRLTGDKLREVELEENLRRKDLTPYERSRTLADLAQLAREQAKAEPDIVREVPAEKERGRPEGRDLGSTRDVSERIGVPDRTIRDAEQHVATAEAYPEFRLRAVNTTASSRNRGEFV